MSDMFEAVGTFVVAAWNWLMPTIFGLKVITVWQAGGLNLLSGFLLKSGNTTSEK